jgi:excisionase family DNA binding protein
MGLEEALRTMLRDIVREVVRDELADLKNQSTDTTTEGLRYVTAREAAEIATVNEETIRVWARQGLLQAHWAGRKLRIERGDLEEFMRRGLPTRSEDLDADEIARRLLGGEAEQ